MVPFPPPASDHDRVDEAAVNEAAAHSAPASALVGELPDAMLRMIWSIRWRADAAEVIQRAVRRSIRRADGLPWDLPSLVYPDDSDWCETGLGRSSEYQHLRWRADAAEVIQRLRGPTHLSEHIECLIYID